MASQDLIATYWETLPGGMMLDLVRDPASGGLNLLIWDGVTASIAPRFEYNGQIYVPASLDPVIRASRLPARVDSYGSTRELFDDVCRLITRFNDLAERFVLQVAHFNFGTWLVDRVPVAPFLSIVAPATAPSGALLQLLALLCRRPLLLGELGSSGLCTLPMQFRPTLLVDAVRLSAPVQRLLRASNSQGVYVPGRGRVLDLYCAKAVCSQEPLCDPSLVGLALQIALAPTRQQLPILDWEASEKIADEFQAKGQMYRLKNYHNVCAPSIDVGGLTAPMQSVARSLAACVVGDEELQSRVVPLLQQQDREIRVERSAGLESVILEALLFCCHDGNRSAVREAELAEITNTILARRGHSLQISAETVGWKLKALGFHTELIGSGGKGLYLLDENRARIHKLARDYGVRSVQQGPMKMCPQCLQADDVGEERDR